MSAVCPPPPERSPSRSAGDGGRLRLAMVSDAWQPQVNGVVRTLLQTRAELVRLGHEVDMLTPQLFATLPCPTYPEIRLSLVGRRQVGRLIDRTRPNAIHIATEGPLGWAARAHCLGHGLPFTTAYHTRFPEYVAARFGIPMAWSYGVLRHFHAPAARVMVPTPTVKRDLEARGFTNVVLWSRGVDVQVFRPGRRDALDGERPIFLYVGRVAIEKNVEAFLALDLPGTKWVVGEGPQLAELRRRYPSARYLGVLKQEQLASVYSAADVFVFPSKTDTFGLVQLEALACGTPVAAYPVSGPLDVIGGSDAGVLDDDLGAACRRALAIPREAALAHAQRFSWAIAAESFVGHLRPVP